MDNTNLENFNFDDIIEEIHTPPPKKQTIISQVAPNTASSSSTISVYYTGCPSFECFFPMGDRGTQGKQKSVWEGGGLKCTSEEILG